MPTSEEELDAKRKRVEKLREDLANEEAKRTVREAGLSGDVQAAELDLEAARLEAQFAVAKNAGSASVMKAGSANLLQDAKDQMKEAAALQKATEKEGS